MLKAFSRLWLVVFVPLFLLMLPSQYSPVVMLNEHFAKARFVNTFQGTFFLLEQRLSKIEQTEWSASIAQIAPEFGYEVNLLQLQEAIARYQREEDFYSGDFVFINSEPELLLRRVASSGFVISLALDITEQEELLRAAQGPFYLLEQELISKPPSSWATYIEEKQSDLNAEVKLLALPQLFLSEVDQVRLSNNQIVWQKDDEQEFIFYKRISNSNQVLQVGAVPATGPSSSMILFLLMSFILIISVGMLLWVLPLWRDLNRLSIATSRFGEGHLDKRADVGKSSVAARLSETFNTMADNIQHLINEHKVLTNSIAHDLRTPLYRLRFAAEMLNDDSLPAEAKLDYQQTINKSLNELDHLISQTLIYSRYSRISDITHFSEVDIKPLFTEEITLFRQQHPELEYVLNIVPSTLGFLVTADCRAINRVISNLLSNASKYAHKHIRTTLYRAEDYCQFSIEDDGPGIPQSARKSIFKPFKQLDNNTRGTGSGHGLGLAIVMEIAKWHSGDVLLEDSELGGIKVVFRWPVTKR